MKDISRWNESSSSSWNNESSWRKDSSKSTGSGDRPIRSSNETSPWSSYDLLRKGGADTDAGGLKRSSKVSAVHTSEVWLGGGFGGRRILGGDGEDCSSSSARGARPVRSYPDLSRTLCVAEIEEGVPLLRLRLLMLDMSRRKESSSLLVVAVMTLGASSSAAAAPRLRRGGAESMVARGDQGAKAPVGDKSGSADSTDRVFQSCEGRDLACFCRAATSLDQFRTARLLL